MDRDDPNRCRFFKWENEISTPTTSRGPDSNNHPRSPSSAVQDSPRKRAIMHTLMEPVTPLKLQASPQASGASFAALREQLGDIHDDDDDDDDELFRTSQVFKIDPYGGKERSQACPFSTPTFPVPRATNGSTLNTPSRKGKSKDKSLFDPLESPLHEARDARVSNWSSLLDHQSSGGRSRETDTDDPAIYIDAVEKLDDLPAYLNKLQGRVSEAESAKKTAEAKVQEYEERMRDLQMENDRLKASRAS